MRISDWSSDVCPSDLRLLDVQLEGGLLRGVPLRGVQEVGGRAAGAAVDVIADGLAVDQHVHRLTNGRIGQRRVLGAERRARAVHLFPRVGPVELAVLDIAAEADVDLDRTSVVSGKSV